MTALFATTTVEDVSDNLSNLDAAIDAAEAYERELARKQLRLRKFILNAIAYRDALQDVGKAVWSNAA